MLAVDQFEETFTALREPDAFLDAIVALAEDRGRRSVVVLAIRADFYGRCAAHPGLARLVAANQVLVGPPQPDELRHAIEDPAARAGLRVESRLSDTLVDELDGAPGALPLLSTALLELWRERDGEQLTLAAYERVGGVRGAVARVAEEAFASLSEGERAIARRLLLRLVDEDERGILVRRRVGLEDLRDAEVIAVLDLLADRRLIAVDAEAAELTHEALLREWPRLAGWLEEDAHRRRVHHHLANAARDWAERGRDPGDLYRAGRLASALECSDDELTALEREFLAAAQERGEREAVAARRTNRRLRALLGGAMALLALAIVAGVVALGQRGQARDAAVGADAERIGATALLEKRLDRSLLLARQGVALDDTVRTRGNLLGAMLRSPAAIGMIRWDARAGHERRRQPGRTARSPSATSRATSRCSTRRPGATSPPSSPPPNHPGIYGLAYSPDGDKLAVLYTSLAGNATGYPPGWRFLVALADAHTRRAVQRIKLPLERAGASVQFSPDGRHARRDDLRRRRRRRSPLALRPGQRTSQRRAGALRPAAPAHVQSVPALAALAGHGHWQGLRRRRAERRQ